jgi:hypothetical protein
MSRKSVIVPVRRLPLLPAPPRTRVSRGCLLAPGTGSRREWTAHPGRLPVDRPSITPPTDAGQASQTNVTTATWTASSASRRTVMFPPFGCTNHECRWRCSSRLVSDRGTTIQQRASQPSDRAGSSQRRYSTLPDALQYLRAYRRRLFPRSRVARPYVSRVPD